MPVPVMNYAALPPAQYGLDLSQIPQGLMQGMQLRNMPKQMSADLQQKQLANALSQIQLQFAPQMNAADLAYKQAQTPYMQAQTGLTNQQTQYYGPNAQSEISEREAQIRLLQAQAAKEMLGVNNPLLNQTGPAGQIGSLLYLQAHPELSGNINGAMGGNGSQNGGTPGGNMSSQGGVNDLAKMISDSLTAQMRQRNAQADLYTKRASGFNYNQLPTSQKQALLAQATALGISPEVASQRFIKGETIDNMALENGYDPNNMPTPVYPTTSANQTQIQKRQQATAELNYLQPLITDAAAPYSRRFAGYSPVQIMQAAKNEDPDSQAKYLAAQALTPEVASLRMKTMQGQVGIEAIREINEKSMGKIKSFQPLVSPEVYKMANKYIDKWLSDAAEHGNKIGLSPKSANAGESSEQTSGSVRKYNPSTGRIE